MISGLFVLCGVFAAVTAGGLLEYGSGLHTAGPIITETRAALPLAASAPLLKYSAAPAVSTSYSSILAPGSVTYGAPITKTLLAPEIASTHQNIIRSFDGTLSHYSKGIDTPFSSVRKIDSRISNNVYSPAIATKTLVSAPGLAATYAAPALATAYATPALATKTLAVSAPAVAATYSAPALATYAAPALAATYAAPAAYATHGSYAAHGSYATPAVAYSAAAPLAHVSYGGVGAKYAW